MLGLVLGDILDKNLRRALVLTDGDLTPFVTRPISLVLGAVTVATILLSCPAVRNVLAAPFRRARASSDAGR